MPYVTNAQKEWAHWCDLGFAVRQICTADGCDEATAVQQLRLAIADGNVRVKWGDKSERYSDEPPFDSSEPTTDEWWWIHHAEFDLDETAWHDEYGELKGLVKDDWCLAPFYRLTGTSPVLDWINERRESRLNVVLEDRVRFRPLLLWSPNIDTIWGWPWPVQESPEAKPTDLPVRRGASRDRIIEACREVYAEHRDDPPNLNTAWKLVREKLPGTPRHLIRDDVLALPEFQSLRRERGVRKTTSKKSGR